MIKAADLNKEFAYGKNDTLFANNFGICAQASVISGNEGLGRVRAVYTGYEHISAKVIESPFAEIAVYRPLQTIGMPGKAFLSDLYSFTQVSQEF